MQLGELLHAKVESNGTRCVPEHPMAGTLGRPPDSRQPAASLLGHRAVLLGCLDNNCMSIYNSTMPKTPLVRVYIACSLDGFIAGPDDDLSWLSSPEGAEPVERAAPEGAVPPASSGEPSRIAGPLHFETFLEQVGALLMGRRTYDVVRGFGGAWPFGDRPVLVATHRPLVDAPPTVRSLAGSIEELIVEARRAAGGRDVYLDGGALIRQALDADLIDDLVVTIAPVVLGSGHPLFAGVQRRRRLTVVSHRDYPGGMVQLHARPQKSATRVS